MKKLYLLILLLVSVSASSVTRPDMSSVVPKPDSINLSHTSANNKASSDSAYKGRNQNVVGTRLPVASTQSNTTLSKTVSDYRNSSDSIQLENLETSMGEVVQKIDDDRMKIVKKQEKQFNDNKKTLKEAYDLIKNLDLDRLGREQDPSVKTPFKCKKYKSTNFNDCNVTSSAEPHKMPDCQEDEQLRWTGQKWECRGLFEVIGGSVSCNADQWSQVLNGGTVCSDYIYSWERNTNWSDCVKTPGGPNYGTIPGTKSQSYKCVRRKVYGGTPENVSDSTKCPGEKPDNYVEACSYFVGCPIGTTLNGNVCDPIICREGTKLIGNSCVAFSCPWGQKISGNTCVSFSCPWGQKVSGNTCVSFSCPWGQKVSGNTCVSFSCPDGQKVSGNTCVSFSCPDGQKVSGNTCVSFSCPAGQKVSGNSCVSFSCLTGQMVSGNACVPIICHAGKKLVGNTCVDICSAPQFYLAGRCACPTGQTAVGNTCIAITCPTGYELVGNRCQ